MTPTCPFCQTAIDEHEAGNCLDKWAVQVLGGPCWWPPLSTSWPGLGLVVEEMGRRGFIVVLVVWPDGHSEVKCARDDDCHVELVDIVAAPTPFLAAVRAAIKAVEEKR